MVAAKRVVSPGPAAPSGPASGVAGAQWSSIHPRWDRVSRLAARRLSGDLSAAEAFREKLLPPYVQLIHSRRELCITPSGGPFVAGILDGKRIPFTRLSEWC